MIGFHATCDCGYQSDGLDTSYENCVCPHCRDLVCVSRILYRYELMPCAKCHFSLFEDDLFSEFLGEGGWLVTEKPSGLTCPKCNAAKLEFHIDVDGDGRDGLYFPGVGDLVDGCIDQNGVLDILWFTLESAKVSHNLPPGLPPGQRVTMRVTAIKTAEPPAGSIQEMFHRNVVTELGLEYIGTLTSNRRSHSPTPLLERPEKYRHYYAQRSAKDPDDYEANGVMLSDWWLRLYAAENLTQAQIDSFIKRLEEEPEYDLVWLELSLQFKHWAKTRGFKA